MILTVLLIQFHKLNHVTFLTICSMSQLFFFIKCIFIYYLTCYSLNKFKKYCCSFILYRLCLVTYKFFKLQILFFLFCCSLYPGDIYPLTRKPLFVIVDSDNSHAFQYIPRYFGQPVLVLMSPEDIPTCFHGKYCCLIFHQIADCDRILAN